MHTKLLCFDLDGTLVDSAWDISSAMNKTLQEYGKKTFPHEFIVEHIGHGLIQLIQDTFIDVKDPIELQKIGEQFLKTYEEQMLNTTLPFPGAIEFLKKWTGPKAIITNKNYEPTMRMLKHLNMLNLNWTMIIGADSLSDRKPNPIGLNTVMKKTGISAENTFMIGDGIPDILSANNAGVKSIAVDFGYTKLDILNGLGAWKSISNYEMLTDLVFSKY